MKTYLITGATGSLGYNIVKYLSREPNTHIVLAVRNVNNGMKIAKQIGKNTSVYELDLCSMDSIDKFISSWKYDLAGLVNNAGIQIVNKTRLTNDKKYEETFFVNHLAAFKLTIGLLPFLFHGRVLFIGSGTHHPDNKAATMFGFRGAKYKSIQNCAEGLSEVGPIDQIGRDRYATSKFLNMVSTIELARRISPGYVSFYCIDPGMMAGTGLARTAPGHMQFIWRHILPFAARFLPDTSTPKRSGGTAAWIMTSENLNKESGTIFSYNRCSSNVVWEKVFDTEIGRSIVDESLDMCGLKSTFTDFLVNLR